MLFCPQAEILRKGSFRQSKAGGMTMKEPDRTLYWIWLAQACDGGTLLCDHLLDAFGDAKGVYTADLHDYEAIAGISPQRLERLQNKDLTEAERISEECKKRGIGVLTLADEAYPDRLKRIKERPPVLYFRGTLPTFDRYLCVAVVGTRRMTEYGGRVASRLGHSLCREGVLVVSGMADGVDGAAHRGALYRGGQTVAVLGCGCDVPYPKKHELLMEEIVRNGAVIGEYPPGTKPVAGNFPRRNRIISGLCQATVVVEADERSGSIITARCALRQGRRVFAVPGNVGEWSSLGTNHLIRDGARSITSAADILNDLRYELRTLSRMPQRAYQPVWDHAAPDGVNAGGEDDFELSADLPAGLPTRPSGEDLSAEDSPHASASSTKRGAGKASPKKKKKEEKTPARQIDPAIPIDAFGQAMLDMFPTDGQPVNPDVLEARLRAEGKSGAVLPALTMLEIAGYIAAAPGGAYRRIDISETKESSDREYD